jgi:hypothetical protein
MLKMSSWIEIFKKKFIWRLFLVFHITLGMFVSSRKCYIVSNKHLMLGLRNFLLWSRLLNLFLVVMILLFLLNALMQVVSFCPYILMTWLLLMMTLMVFQFWRLLYSLKWRIWVIIVIPWVLRYLNHPEITFFLSRNMLQIFLSG